METESVNWLVALWAWYTTGGASAWISAITGVLTAATAITIITPTTVDNKIVGWALKILNIAAGNILANRNADDK